MHQCRVVCRTWERGERLSPWYSFGATYTSKNRLQVVIFGHEFRHFSVPGCKTDYRLVDDMQNRRSIGNSKIDVWGSGLFRHQHYWNISMSCFFRRLLARLDLTPVSQCVIHLRRLPWIWLGSFFLEYYLFNDWLTWWDWMCSFFRAFGWPQEMRLRGRTPPVT